MTRYKHGHAKPGSRSSESRKPAGFVRKRTTKAGSLSTTLVESYRDKSGRPRQRILANLHGEPTTLKALAKLVATHDQLLEQREQEHAEPSGKGAGFVLVTERALTEHNHRITQIDRRLAAMRQDMAVIGQHCSASDDEFQQAMQRYKREYCEAFERAVGLAKTIQVCQSALDVSFDTARAWAGPHAVA